MVELPLALQAPRPELAALRDAVLAATDPRRLRRGLAGHRTGAVLGAWSGDGWVLGRVRGKRGVQVTAARLLHGRLEVDCDCADTTAPCAHVAAVLAAAMGTATVTPGRETGDRPGGAPGRDPGASGPVEWRQHWSHGPLPEASPETADETPPPDVASHLARAPGADLLEALGPLYGELGEG